MQLFHSPRPLAAARIAAVAMLLALGACGHRDQTVWLGLQFPLTGSGDLADSADAYGQLSRMGAAQALDEINAARAGGMPRLATRLVNDRGDDGTAIGVADSLAKDARVIA